MSEQKTYLTKVNKTHDGQMAIDFPPALFDSLNWGSGDVLVWAPLPDGEGFVVSKLKTEF